MSQRLQAEPPSGTSRAAWADAQAFYARRGQALAWCTGSDLSRAFRALETLRSAQQHGLQPADYDEPAIAQQVQSLREQPARGADRSQQLADADLHLTVELLMLGRDVAVGRTSPLSSDERWKARRKLPPLVETLAAAVDGGVERWLDAVRPQHPEYAALQKALIDLAVQRDRGGWPIVPAGTLKRGMSGTAVTLLRKRLMASDELEGAAAAPSAAYDSQLESAVNAFQEHHGIKPTGIAGPETVAAMNVPVEARERQVAINLERWRWMPDDLGTRYLLVNIPAYHVTAIEDGAPVLDLRAIVGKRGNETPVFSAVMRTVVFSPYWNIPDAIAADETAPAAAKDPRYLDRLGIEILRPSKSGVTIVDPSRVDWHDTNALRDLAFRQRPGSTNALGNVKFLFPNPFDVYLHDTPAGQLFGRSGRAFSHGCIRVEEPAALARYVLRDDTAWDEAKILEAMHAGVERSVELKTTLPVHIVYFTARMDRAGGLQFLADVYGYDRLQ